MNGSGARADAGSAALSLPLQHMLCILVVAGAIKMPLGIPLYLNAGLLLLGLLAIMVVQSLEWLFAWMVALVILGIAGAAEAGSLPVSAPRLGQVLLIVFATSLIARLDPTLLARYLPVLVPFMVLVAVVESLLPEPLYASRPIFGLHVLRQAGLHGEPNYNAMLYGVIGAILAQYRPRVLSVFCFVMAIPSLSRGLLAALVAWLGAQALGRWMGRLALPCVLVLALQPLIVLQIDAMVGDAGRETLARWSSLRFPVWAAYAQMGLNHTLGVGYFQGEIAITAYEIALRPDGYAQQAHSIFLQVFGEFGWLGYLAFVGFLIQLTRRVARLVPEQVPLLLFVLTGYAFVNGLSDWPFWVAIGYVLGHARLAERQTAPT